MQQFLQKDFKLQYLILQLNLVGLPSRKLNLKGNKNVFNKKSGH
jgi:hypothetical protein